MTFYRSILGSRSKRGDYCWLTNDPGPSVTLAAVHTLAATEQTGREQATVFASLSPNLDYNQLLLNFYCNHFLSPRLGIVAVQCRPMPVQNNLCSHEPLGMHCILCNRIECRIGPSLGGCWIGRISNRRGWPPEIDPIFECNHQRVNSNNLQRWPRNATIKHGLSNWKKVSITSADNKDESWHKCMGVQKFWNFPDNLKQPFHTQNFNIKVWPHVIPKVQSAYVYL